MTHGIMSTISVAALGLFAARAADFFRIPASRRKECDKAPRRGGAWRFSAEATQQQRSWV